MILVTSDFQKGFLFFFPDKLICSTVYAHYSSDHGYQQLSEGTKGPISTLKNKKVTMLITLLQQQGDSIIVTEQ